MSFVLLLLSFLLLRFPAWNALREFPHPSVEITRPVALQRLPDYSPHREQLSCDGPHNLAFNCSLALHLLYSFVLAFSPQLGQVPWHPLEQWEHDRRPTTGSQNEQVNLVVMFRIHRYILLQLEEK